MNIYDHFAGWWYDFLPDDAKALPDERRADVAAACQEQVP